MIKFTIITLFREALQPYLDASMLMKAQKIGAAEFEFVNLRNFGLGPHKSVDDTPYGGGDGMLLRVEPVFAAVEAIEKTKNSEVILFTPAGKLWTQALARKFAGITTTDFSHEALEKSITKKFSGATTNPSDSAAIEATTKALEKHYILICPHYEGYDERIATLADHKISIGNYVLTGGELPALIFIDSIVRLLPGVLGGDSSASIESFADAASSTVEFPQYTKPAEFHGMKVPDVLLSGDHAKIADWRLRHSR